MVPDTAVIIQFVIASAVLAITPGPDMTLFLSRALSQGTMAGIACMSGALSGIAIHTAMVALGLSALIVAAPAAFTALKVIGAGYLVWLAFSALRHGSALNLRATAGKRQGFRKNFLTGLGINLLNPKIILFFMTFLPQFVRADDPDATGKLFFLGGLFIVTSVPIVLPMILAADRMADFLRARPVVTRIVDWVFAGVFSAFAVRILVAQGR